jgi:hypothetical protein
VIQLSRRIALAGLAIAGSDAAAMPQRLWHGATHFALDCRLQGFSPREAATFCERLAPIAMSNLKLTYRQTAAPDDVILRLDLRREGGGLTGSLVAIRRALRGETDEQSSTVPVMLSTSDPGSGLLAALGLMRNPVLRSAPRRVRPAA